jgi:uncharacterized protein (TIGR01777 family)
MQRKAVIAGGSGFLGHALARDLVSRGWEVAVLSRSGVPAASGASRGDRGFAAKGEKSGGDAASTSIHWDGKTLGDWKLVLDGADVVFNFAGRSVACVYTPENRRQILESRLDSVHAVGAAVRAAQRPPPVWIQATTLAIYGNPGDLICDESTPPAASGDLPVEVSKAWEAAFDAEPTPASVRKVALRIGFVLGRNGGALEPLEKLAKAFLGGAAGSGQQYISWIHAEDFCAICRWAIDHPGAQGAYNACAPDPVTNAQFMRELRRAVRRPWSPPVPAWVIKLAAPLIMRADASLALTGRRCVPRRLLEQGFRFFHTDLRETLGDLT